MREMRTLNWLVLLASVLLMVIVTACGQSGPSKAPYTPTFPAITGTPPFESPSPNPADTADVIFSFPNPNCPEGAICSALVTPGVPPGIIDTYGTVESEQCYDPHNLACRVPRTGQVVGGNLNITYTVPINTYLDIGYVLANQIRVDGIRIQGTLLTSFGALGTAPNQFPVACFIVRRDQAGAITVGTNPGCTAIVKRLRLVVSGDSGGVGISSYTNNVYNGTSSFDDGIVPYTGLQAGEDIRITTSLWANPTPGGVWQALVWDATANAYTETFYSVLANQAAFFTIHHPSRDPLCMGASPACDYVPGYGAYLDNQPLGGGVSSCTTQLIHYIDLDPSANYWIGITTTGFNTTAPNCVTQGAETRGLPISAP